MGLNSIKTFFIGIGKILIFGSIGSQKSAKKMWVLRVLFYGSVKNSGIEDYLPSSFIFLGKGCKGTRESSTSDGCRS